MVVGLRVPPPSISLTSGISSIYKAVLGPKEASEDRETREPPQLEGDSLGEMWVNFLLQEAQAGKSAGSERSAAGSAPSSPQKAGSAAMGAVPVEAAAEEEERW